MPSLRHPPGVTNSIHQVMKSILHQMLEGARFLHERGILHRDLKPSNLIVSLAPAATSTADGHGGEPGDNTDFPPPSMTSRATTPERGWARGGGRRRGNNGDGGMHEGSAGSGGEKWSSYPKSSSSKSSLVWLRVADFSSAVDEGSISAGLYGAKGPVQEGEETLQYAPPEVLFDSEVRDSVDLDQLVYLGDEVNLLGCTIGVLDEHVSGVSFVGKTVTSRVAI